MMDPQHRIFLELCWHALEKSGCDSEQYNGSIGVFAGSTFNSYLLNNVLNGRGQAVVLIISLYKSPMIKIIWQPVLLTR